LAGRQPGCRAPHVEQQCLEYFRRRRLRGIEPAAERVRDTTVDGRVGEAATQERSLVGRQLTVGPCDVEQWRERQKSAIDLIALFAVRGMRTILDHRVASQTPQRRLAASAVP